MNTNRHFPEVSNWERRDGQYYDDHVTNVWYNLHTGYAMRTITVTGPFGTNTSKEVLQIREMYMENGCPPEGTESLWTDKAIIQEETFVLQSFAEEAAHQFAKQHNDPEE